MYTRKRRTLPFTALQLLGLHARGWVRRSDKRRQNQHLDSPRRSTDEIEKGRDAARNAQAIYMNCTPVHVQQCNRNRCEQHVAAQWRAAYSQILPHINGVTMLTTARRLLSEL